jgi:hypothetical protein
MNIFFVDTSPVIAAEMLANAHVRSQIKESLDMLSTAHYMAGSHTEEMRSPTHRHHPCTKWVMAGEANYMWLLRHVQALCDEYKYRHGVPHHLEPMTKALRSKPVNSRYLGHITVPPAVVTEDLKPDIMKVVKLSREQNIDLIVKAYRAYYNRDKRHLHYWMVRKRPAWIKLPDGQFDHQRWEVERKARLKRKGIVINAEG